MKPLNLDNKPCSPISSNCVVWQGPDISCINICKGDTVSDVVAALATELCTILDQTNVSNYDLTCLGITTCGPKDFQALIQLLIDKICELQGITPEEIRTESACPDCVVTVAECFVENNQTTMQLIDYVQMIADKVCSLVTQISFLSSQISDLTIRVENLENAATPTFTQDSFTLACTIGTLSGEQFINTILEEFINNIWCDFSATTGTTTELNDAINSICILDTDLQLTSGDPFSTNPDWVQAGNYDTVADAINNLWIALCDIYNAVDAISVTGSTSNSVDVTVTSGVIEATINDTGWVDLIGFDHQVGIGLPQCRRIGNVIHFRGLAVIPLRNALGTGVLDIADANTYRTTNYVTPYVGPNGVYIDADGNLFFNNDGTGAQPVIPTSVVDTLTPLDSSYRHPRFYLNRDLAVETFLGSGIFGTALCGAAGTLKINADKTLRFSPLSVLEQSIYDDPGANLIGNASLRNITTRFNSRSFMVNYGGTTPFYDGSDSKTNSSVLSALSSTTIGVLYTIIARDAADDFTLIGAVNNNPGTSFIATANLTLTGTSQLLYGYRSESGFYTDPGGGTTTQWPAIVDAAGLDASIADNLGGFGINLDGMTAYVDVCTTDQKPTDCSK